MFNRFARGRTLPTKKTGPNKTEADYGTMLELLLRAGKLVAYKFEKIKLKLADNTFYTPDYYVINDRMELEFHEVKGFWEDDARVKIKVAAEQYPHFKFIAASKDRESPGGWKAEQF